MSMVNPFENIEAEKSVLGCALQDKESAKTVAGLPESLFTKESHKAIHACVRALVNAGSPVDLITMDAAMCQQERYRTCNSATYLVSLLEFTPTTANLRYYAELLEACSMRRELKYIGERLMDAAGNTDTDPLEARENTALALRDLYTGDTAELITAQEAALNTYEKIGDKHKHIENPNAIFFGIPLLDEKLGGISGGKMVVIGARPSVGKSALALSFCLNGATNGKKVLLISLEMDEIEITERVFAHIGKVPLPQITSGNLDQPDWEDVARTAGKAANLPLWYCVTARTVEQIRKVAMQLFEKNGLDAVVVDYIQLMSATHAAKQNRQEQVAEISRGLRSLSMDLKIPVVALTQLNRQSEGGGQHARRQPVMSDSRESGAIEQDANVFIILHDPTEAEIATQYERDAWELVKQAGMTLIRVIIDKNRQGKKGMLSTAFDGAHMMFHDIRALAYDFPKEAEPQEETTED